MITSQKDINEELVKYRELVENSWPEEKLMEKFPINTATYREVNLATVTDREVSIEQMEEWVNKAKAAGACKISIYQTKDYDGDFEDMTISYITLHSESLQEYMERLTKAKATQIESAIITKRYTLEQELRTYNNYLELQKKYGKV